MIPAPPAPDSRSWLWVQLIIGWLPVWALMSVLTIVAHDAPVHAAMWIGLRLVACAALLGWPVHRLTRRLPWPHPMRIRFATQHLAAALLYAVAWLVLNSVVESVLRGRLVIAAGPGIGAFLVTGVWLYTMVAAVAYSARAAERSAQLQALEARTQLAALRAQLHPHFLFNALHTVVQLIPIDPRSAAHAAEQLAGLLRSSFEDTGDLVPLAQEWAVVQRYLAIEAIRFGERLRLHSDIAPAALDARLPSFALQTLVENAVRHAAAPAIDGIDLHIQARCDDRMLMIEVSDNGAGTDLALVQQGGGSGLRRLRERLGWLLGSGAELQLVSAPGQGFVARLRVPQDVALNDD